MVAKKEAKQSNQFKLEIYFNRNEQGGDSPLLVFTKRQKGD